MQNAMRNAEIDETARLRDSERVDDVNDDDDDDDGMRADDTTDDDGVRRPDDDEDDDDDEFPIGQGSQRVFASGLSAGSNRRRVPAA